MHVYMLFKGKNSGRTDKKKRQTEASPARSGKAWEGVVNVLRQQHIRYLAEEAMPVLP